MTTRGSNELTSENLLNTSTTQRSFDAAAADDRRRAKATVTYAPLPVWNYSHWIGRVTSSAPMLQDRPE
jgi:hypothetical protein